MYMYEKVQLFPNFCIVFIKVDLLMYEGMYVEAIKKLQLDESTTWSIRYALKSHYGYLL